MPSGFVFGVERCHFRVRLMYRMEKVVRGGVGVCKKEREMDGVMELTAGERGGTFP